MARIRRSLDGVVIVNGHTLHAGDLVPDGVVVGPHLLGDGEEASEQSCDGCRTVEPLTGEELDAAEKIGLPVEGLDPERVRGAVFGFEVGFEAGVESVSDPVASDKASNEQSEGDEQGNQDAAEGSEVAEAKPAAKRGPGRPKKAE